VTSGKRIRVAVTGTDALEELRQQLVGLGTVVGLARAKQELLAHLEPTGLTDRIGADRIFPTLPTAVAAYREATGE
jgi:MFS superfamily sulfate permease-like transporter